MSLSKKKRVDSPPDRAVVQRAKCNCPVCLAVPPKEIYLCGSGHSMCTYCVHKVGQCPICRVSFGEQRIRRPGLDQVLESLKLKCRWDGCNEGLPRGGIAEHEKNCRYNPDVYKVVRVINDGNCTCNCTITLESLEAGLVIHHLKLCHGLKEITIKSINWREKVMPVVRIDTFISQLATTTTKTKYVHGHFLKNLVTFEYDDKKQQFLQVIRIYADKDGQDVLEIFFIHLMTGPIGQEMFRSDIYLENNDACKAKTTWITTPIKLADYLKACEKPVAEQPKLSFPIPLSTVYRYYLNQFCYIQYGYNISMSRPFKF